MLTFPVFAVGNMQDLTHATFVASSSVRRTDFQFLRSNLVLHSQSEPVGRQYPYISICSCPIFSDTLFRISFPATSPSDTFTHYHPLSTSFISRMAATAVEPAPVEVPGLPDYVLDPNATLKDATATWRHGRAPDYSQTRKVYEESTSISSSPRTTSNCFHILIHAGQTAALSFPTNDS